MVEKQTRPTRPVNLLPIESKVMESIIAVDVVFSVSKQPDFGHSLVYTVNDLSDPLETLFLFLQMAPHDGGQYLIRLLCRQHLHLSLLIWK